MIINHSNIAAHLFNEHFGGDFGIFIIRDVGSESVQLLPIILKVVSGSFNERNVPTNLLLGAVTRLGKMFLRFYLFFGQFPWSL